MISALFPVWAVDAIGVCVFAATGLVFVGVIRRLLAVLRQGDSVVAQALLVAATGYLLYSAYAMMHILTRYVLTGWRPFVHVDVAFIMRLVFLGIAIRLYRALGPEDAGV